MVRTAAMRSVSLFGRNLLSRPASTSLLPVPLPSPPASSFPKLFPFKNGFSVENPRRHLSGASMDEDRNRKAAKIEDVSREDGEMNDVKFKSKGLNIDVDDVSNKELKLQIDKYFKENDEEVLPTILESILRRKAARKHEETDDELLDELQMRPPLDDVNDQEFESDFEELHETDEELEDLYNARDYVIKKMVKNEYFNMDDKKWDEMIKESIEHGHIKDTKECEEILEDMLTWEKVLPDDIKKKIQEKYNEIADKVETGELAVEEGYKEYQEFEDEMMRETARLMDKDGPPHVDETAAPDKKDLDDPPGEGPILRWQTRVVFAPGGDAWHPKNRKVKLSVTVKELGMSKHQFRRLRELVGKRYHPGRDELTITSERFEHREENRKDCLRTLFSLIEEAGKANKLVDDARTSYVKNRLRANDNFMRRLNAKIMRKQGSDSPLHV